MYRDRESQQSEFDGRRRGRLGCAGDGLTFFWLPLCIVVVMILNIAVLTKTLTEKRIENRIQEYRKTALIARTSLTGTVEHHYHDPGNRHHKSLPDGMEYRNVAAVLGRASRPWKNAKNSRKSDSQALSFIHKYLILKQKKWSKNSDHFSLIPADSVSSSRLEPCRPFHGGVFPYHPIPVEED